MQPRQGKTTSRSRRTSLGRAGTSQLHQRGETPSRQEGRARKSEKPRPHMAGDASQHSRTHAVMGKVPPSGWPRTWPPGPSCGQRLSAEEPDKVPPNVQEGHGYLRPEQAKGTRRRQSRSARPGTEDKNAQIGEREGRQPREGPPESRDCRPDSLRLPASSEGVGFILQRRRRGGSAGERGTDGTGTLRRRQPVEALKDGQLAKK